MKNKNSIAAAAAIVVILLAPRASRAAEDGQLWEVSTKMEIPGGAPEGMMGAMGGNTAQVCRGEDPREAITKDKEMSECEIKDFKQTDTTVSMSAICEEGRTAKIEIIYNKARTGYKGTIRIKEGKGGDEMTMRTTGKKIGPCDPKKARAEQSAMIEKHKAMGDDVQAQYKAAMKKSESDQIKGCAKGLDSMNPGEFGLYGSCYRQKDASCKSVMADYAKAQPKVATECPAKAAEFCKGYQTPEGFQKVGRKDSMLDAAGRMCGVSPDDLRPKLCKGAAKSESFEFLGAHCPDQAKPLAKKHCAGRSYTVKEGDPRRVDKKWFKFCVAVAGARAGGEDSTAEETPTPKSVKDQAKSEAKEATKKAAKGAAVDAFKGLFGR